MNDKSIRPNVVFVFSDQHRAQSTGYSQHRDSEVLTPNLNQMASEGINFTNAISGCPVCSPYRASLMTGQFPQTHGVFLNDVCLSNDAVSIAEAFTESGYDTGYIGKWHLDGHGRSNYIPKERRQGFDYWKVLECTHDYNESDYYANDSENIKRWKGYDVIAQTEDALNYIEEHSKDQPFMLMLSYGPPHNPYESAPEAYKNLYDCNQIDLRPNVPKEQFPKRFRYGEAIKEETLIDVKEKIAGYYAHITTIDAMVGSIRLSLKSQGIEDNTIFIYSSDHGDMLYSQGQIRKQRPWDESIRVPFLLSYPQLFKGNQKNVTVPLGAADIMPTLLDLCGIEIPHTVEGYNFGPYLRGEKDSKKEAELLLCMHPFGEFERRNGGREYRGIRTERYTYVRDKNGPWLLFDNLDDPYQLTNVCETEGYISEQYDLEKQLKDLLRERNDDFLFGEEYIQRWGYEVDEHGTIPYY